MSSLLSASRISFHKLIANVSSLFGIIVFLQQLWGPASLEHTLVTAASTGLAAYLILAVGYAAARGVLRHADAPDEEADESTEADASSEESDDESADDSADAVDDGGAPTQSNARKEMAEASAA